MDGSQRHGYAAYSLALRGHGQSPGKPGHINTWGAYRDDVRAWRHIIEKQVPG